MTDAEKPNEGEFILYQTPEGTVRIEVLYESETFWLNQKKIADLFGVDLRTVNEHLRNIYAEGELSEAATIRKIRRVQTEGKREVSRQIEFYNLDAIISVGYRVNSTQATQFRIWATQTLREFVIKGFVLDDERLKLNKRIRSADQRRVRLRRGCEAARRRTIRRLPRPAGPQLRKRFREGNQTHRRVPEAERMIDENERRKMEEKRKSRD